MSTNVPGSVAHIPSTGHLPLLNEYRFLSNTLSFARNAYARCGPVSRGWWLFKPTIYLMSAEGNELVLFDREGRFSAKKGWERVLAALFPRGRGSSLASAPHAASLSQGGPGSVLRPHESTH
jgi:hypothetical protein